MTIIYVIFFCVTIINELNEALVKCKMYIFYYDGRADHWLNCFHTCIDHKTHEIQLQSIQKKEK